MELAGIGLRILARIIDAALLWILAILANASAWGSSSQYAWSALWMLSIAVQMYLVATSGQSIGKKVVSIRIAKFGTLDNPGLWHAVIIREIVFLFLWWVSILLMIFDQRFRRGIHDLAAGTVVIRLTRIPDGAGKYSST